jgi:hypothetical protein
MSLGSCRIVASLERSGESKFSYWLYLFLGRSLHYLHQFLNANHNLIGPHRRFITYCHLLHEWVARHIYQLPIGDHSEQVFKVNWIIQLVVG